MIPRQITLKNFLSYREASLDFSGLHVVCIAGPNGAGKSSLLEAMGWVLWGQSRVATDDDVIHQGAMETQVVFVFQQGDHGYRVIRRRHRQQGATLDFQVQTAAGYRSLTQRTMRATQQLICHHLKLDYDTFINSAYLRQGGADEFMLKRPSERKAVLARLLKLDQYDRLAERARDQARQAKAEVDLRTQQLTGLTATLDDYETTLQSQAQLEADLQALDQDLAQTQAQIQALQAQAQAHREQQEQRRFYEQQRQQILTLQQQTQAALALTEAEGQHYQRQLAEAEAIQAGVAELEALEGEVQTLGQRLQEAQSWQQRLDTLTADYQAQAHTLQAQQQKHQIQLEAVLAQRQDLAHTLDQTDNVKAACDQLAVAKVRLKHLDALHLQVGPLRQRQQQLQAQLQHQETQLQTRLEEAQATLTQLRQQQADHPPLEVSAQAVEQTLSYLERRQAYQDQVRDKGLERRSFVATLQAKQRDCETQMAEMAQKLSLLGQPEALCPLCDRPLDSPHRALVTDRHRRQQQDLQDQIWVIREQLAASEREIQVLRQEYRAVEAELALYGPVIHRQGQIDAQRTSQQSTQQRLRELEQVCDQLQRTLQDRSFAPDLQAELGQIDHTLHQLAYDDRDHALARGQVNRLRWADLKQHDLTQAQERQRRLRAQQRHLEQALAEVERQQTTLATGPLAQEIQALQAQLSPLQADLDRYQSLRVDLEKAQHWRSRQRDLDQARQRWPLVEQRCADLRRQQQEQGQTLGAISQSIEPDPSAPVAADPDALAHLTQHLAAQQQQRDQRLAQVGALAQMRQHHGTLMAQIQQQRRDLATAQQQQRVYQELALAFGRKGIQALMIENLLPQLEAEANHLLGRLSHHQLHLCFVTQRVSKGRQDKHIETLDILIADAQGTRPYETYSGGEAFRINFALRLALARILAQRSGLALQLLIIDEGFGSQDQQGCDQLIAAINAIAPDFACILAVTHIPHLRDAFSTRLDITKTAQGSQLTLSV
ncbi:MAG: SMC family ATPase [Leptolyngbya sp.]|nr:SMC family ATPase [Leptolyngbya sp.]